MTLEGHIKTLLGEMSFRIADLTSQLELSLAKNAELETKLKELTETQAKPQGEGE